MNDCSQLCWSSSRFIIEKVGSFIIAGCPLAADSTSGNWGFAPNTHWAGLKPWLFAIRLIVCAHCVTATLIISGDFAWKSFTTSTSISFNMRIRRSTKPCDQWASLATITSSIWKLSRTILRSPRKALSWSSWTFVGRPNISIQSIIPFAAWSEEGLTVFPGLSPEVRYEATVKCVAESTITRKAWKTSSKHGKKQISKATHSLNLSYRGTAATGRGKFRASCSHVSHLKRDAALIADEDAPPKRRCLTRDSPFNACEYCLCTFTIADLKAGGTWCHSSKTNSSFSLKTTSALRRRSEGYASTSASSTWNTKFSSIS